MSSTVLALDVGTVRIGVARANTIARIPEPLVTLANQPAVFQEIKALVKQHAAEVIVVGLPRNLEGSTTAQTAFTEQFITQLRQAIPAARIIPQDEALSSKRAKQYALDQKKAFARQSVDALAACFILQDYLQSQPIH